MDRRQYIKIFVQHTLGCACPDKIFEHIREQQVAAASLPHNRTLTIGGRLLIYIWHVKDQVNFEAKLFALLAAGKQERDETGLNRFRAVLATDDPQNLEPMVQLCFSRFEDRDDRLHVHLVTPDALEHF